MDGRYRGVPVCLVGDKVLPEGSGAKLGRYNDRTSGKKRGEEPGEKAVDVEKRHDEHGSVSRAQLICCLDVLCQLLAIENPPLADCILIVLVKFLCVKGTCCHVSQCHTIYCTTTYSFRSPSGPACV